MAKSQNIFIIGPIGAGKTTIGRMLSKKLSREFYDSDHEIEERTGADINWIFDIEGEAGFREREVKVIDDLTQMQGIILSTGGGVILREENRKVLAARGFVVYLHVSVEQQLQRTEKDRKRPLLRTKDRRSVFEEMQKIRDPLYREIADITLSTNSNSIPWLVKEIIKSFETNEE